NAGIEALDREARAGGELTPDLRARPDGRMGADRREGRKADADRGDVAQSDTAATIGSRSSIGSGRGSVSRGRASPPRRVPPFPHPRAQRAPPGAPARATPAPARSEEKRKTRLAPTITFPYNPTLSPARWRGAPAHRTRTAEAGAHRYGGSAAHGRDRGSGAHADRPLSRRTFGSQGTRARCDRDPRSAGAQPHRRLGHRGRDPRQRGLGGPGPGAGAAGSAEGWRAGHRRRDGREPRVRLWP